MKNKLAFFLILTTLLGCNRYCDMVLHHGEILRIPIEFQNFKTSELSNILVYRINKDTATLRDTLMLIDIVFINEIRSNKVEITDKDRWNRFGQYESYFNNCNLVFDWGTGTDTLKNMEVLKSKREVEDKCHKDDPNIRIDNVSFSHKGSIFKKDETVIIQK